MSQSEPFLGGNASRPTTPAQARYSNSKVMHETCIMGCACVGHYKSRGMYFHTRPGACDESAQRSVNRQFVLQLTDESFHDLFMSSQMKYNFTQSALSNALHNTVDKTGGCAAMGFDFSMPPVGYLKLNAESACTFSWLTFI